MININEAVYASLYGQLVSKRANIALVGLGYVGMPIAIVFAKKGLRVIGFDTNVAKIELYKRGIDPTKKVEHEEINYGSSYFWSW